MTMYSFGSFELDARRRRLTHKGQPVALSDRHLRVLLQLLARAGTTVSKDALVAAAWDDVAVTDNSLEQAISAIRRALTADGTSSLQIETVPRQGYRFAGPLTRRVSRESDATLEAMMAPHRAWLEGRAALESLKRDRLVLARAAFERALVELPDSAAVHVGLANASVMEFESTRGDADPDIASLRTAVHHAQEACRLDPNMGEAWATLGFVLARVDRLDDALAAARRAVTLEPDNWRHQFRLSSIAWGEERLRAAKRTLALVPAFPLAHYLAATVHVARQTFDDAERELQEGIVGQTAANDSEGRFGGVALYWLLGLVRLARGDENGATHAFTRELESEHLGLLYTREVCANSLYAIGAQCLRQGEFEAARQAFDQCLARRPRHALAVVGRAHAVRLNGAGDATFRPDTSLPHNDQVLARAADAVLRARHAEAAGVIDQALRDAPAGSAFWLLPLEPLLRVADAPETWATPLARVRSRAV